MRIKLPFTEPKKIYGKAYNHRNRNHIMAKFMTLGGRPRDGPGHKAFNLSLRRDVYKMLRKLPANHRSPFIEQKITPVLEQLDPGPACKTLGEMDEIARKRALEAIKEGDYDEAMAICSMMYELQDDRVLCSETEADQKNCEDSGGKWDNGTCTLKKHDPSRRYLTRS